ncbi:hypothetical protein R3P38DRAFT_3132210 [Favolaschia claudopus]|uniref:Uncharacterized protein n=1 Tax=Favolaschia claudopus TaxID=2862362 RepID=A0AAV9Z957_9AGAR
MDSARRHGLKNFQLKGTSRNMNTRVGEGFQQEVSALYKKTNGKDAEHQISILDENEETMARLDMAVNAWQESQAESEELKLIAGDDSDQEKHWKLGSPESPILPRRLEVLRSDNRLYHNFDMRLREYLASCHPASPIRLEDDIKILPCKTLVVNYQSMVNWKGERDILRCNPKFHNKSRYDSIIFSAENNPLALGKLELVFRCFLPRGVTLDLAMVRTYRNSSSPTFISLEHVERGALLCPVFGASKEVFYIIDCIDEDMYLRVNRID